MTGSDHRSASLHCRSLVVGLDSYKIVECGNGNFKSRRRKARGYHNRSSDSRGLHVGGWSNRVPRAS